MDSDSIAASLGLRELTPAQRLYHEYMLKTDPGASGAGGTRPDLIQETYRYVASMSDATALLLLDIKAGGDPVWNSMQSDEGAIYLAQKYDIEGPVSIATGGYGEMVIAEAVQTAPGTKPEYAVTIIEAPPLNVNISDAYQASLDAGAVQIVGQISRDSNVVTALATTLANSANTAMEIKRETGVAITPTDFAQLTDVFTLDPTLTVKAVTDAVVANAVVANAVEVPQVRDTVVVNTIDTTPVMIAPEGIGKDTLPPVDQLEPSVITTPPVVTPVPIVSTPIAPAVPQLPTPVSPVTPLTPIVTVPQPMPQGMSNLALYGLGALALLLALRR